MNIDLDEMLQLASSFLAFFLFIISFLAYMRERRKKLFLLSAAFFFYSLMEFLDAGDIFSPKIGEYFEIAGNSLNFIILALFFLSMITKE